MVNFNEIGQETFTTSRRIVSLLLLKVLYILGIGGTLFSLAHMILIIDSLCDTVFFESHYATETRDL